MKLPKPSEHQIQQTIINYLRIKRWYVLRLNSGKYSVGEGLNKRFIMGQDAGTPDIMAFKQWWPDGAPNKSELSLLFIEVKRPGKKATLLQESKMKELEEYGARCLIATSVEDLQKKGI